MSRRKFVSPVGPSRLLSAIAVVLGGLLALTVTSHAQLTPEQQQVMQTAQSADGWLTESEHRAFWKPLAPETKSPAVIAAWRQEMDKLLGLSLRFQLETWKSIQQSQREGRVSKTPDYEQAKQAVMSSRIPGVQPGRAVDEAERMFVAVANKAPYSSANGPIYLTEETVEKALSGFEGAFCRVRRLMDPKWSAVKAEFKYPAARLKIIAECPLAVEYEELTTEQGIKVKTTSLTYVASESEYALLAFVPLKGRWADPNGALTRSIQASFKHLGVTEARPVLTVWRGRNTATASSSIKTSQGTMNVVGRVIEGTAVQGFWTLTAMSTQSPADAHVLLESVEKSLALE